jgi:hypothetical protein
MTSARFRSGFLGLTMAMIGASVTSAQSPVSSIAELNRLGDTKTKVIVIDTAGREFRGRIAHASEAQLSLRIGQEIRSLPAEAVRSVRVRREDSGINGALIGAALSGGLASLMFLDNECRDDPVCYKATAVYTGIGALAGFGIDALIHGSVVVYSAAIPSPQLVVTLSPLVVRGRTGVRLLVAF